MLGQIFFVKHNILYVPQLSTFFKEMCGKGARHKLQKFYNCEIELLQRRIIIELPKGGKGQNLFLGELRERRYEEKKIGVLSGDNRTRLYCRYNRLSCFRSLYAPASCIMHCHRGCYRGYYKFCLLGLPPLPVLQCAAGHLSADGVQKVPALRASAGRQYVKNRLDRAIEGRGNRSAFPLPLFAARGKKLPCKGAQIVVQ